MTKIFIGICAIMAGFELVGEAGVTSVIVAFALGGLLVISGIKGLLD